MGNTQRKPKENSDKPQEEEEEEDAISTFTCEICIEQMPSNKKFKNKNMCAHPFCTDCIAKYIKVKLEDHDSNVDCPGLNCKLLLDPLSCRPIVPPNLFVKWCDKLCDSAVQGVERCYCPNRDCSTLVVNECGGSVRNSKCPNCKKLFCFQCKLPWHAGYRCGESGEMRDRNDVLFGLLVERMKWTRCPGCGHCVELQQGCSTIKCRCRTSFCYQCGGKLSNGYCRCRRPELTRHLLKVFLVVATIFAMLFFLSKFLVWVL